MTRPTDPRLFAPATERNRDPILEVLKRVLPPTGSVLEIASGTGEHAVYFAPRLAPRRWIPSEPDPRLRASIEAWRLACPTETLDPPLPLQVEEAVWSVPDVALLQAIVCINMIHIAPWSATLGLMAGAHRMLPAGGILYLYGPYQQDGSHTAPSNAAFDQQLRSQDPAWGVRHLEDVVAVAQAQGLVFLEAVKMPANNLSLVFRHSG